MFKPGDIVTPSELYFQDGGRILKREKKYKVLKYDVTTNYVRLEVSNISVVSDISIDFYFFAVKYLTFFQSKTKEEYLILKIKYLWEKQDYYKEYLDKSSEIC